VLVRVLPSVLFLTFCWGANRCPIGWARGWLSMPDGREQAPFQLGRGLLGRAAGVRPVGLSMSDGREQAPFQLGRGLLGQAPGGLY